MTRILVAGNATVDAGKTTFTRGLLTTLGGRAIKPRAGNNWWYDHQTVRRALDDGRLFGADAEQLADAHSNAVRPESVNPFHRLWQPAPYAPGDGLIGGIDMEFVLDRVGNHFVVNAQATLPGAVSEALPLADATVVRTLPELNDAMRERHLPRLQGFEAALEGEPTLIVESYGDIALPTASIAYDCVAVVEPGRVRYYDGDRFTRVAQAVSSSPREGSMEPVVPDVIRELEPFADLPLPPLRDSQRTTAREIAEAYSSAYEPVGTGSEHAE